MPRNALHARYLFPLVFLASGFAGLIYESIWSKYLKLFLGHAAYAQALVLIVFMGGMSLGAWIASRISDRLASPIKAYAVVEAAIGVMALLFHPLYGAVTGWLFGDVLPGVSALPQANAIVWSAATLLILPPAILLGATFPLMTAGVSRINPARSGKTIALLYFTNSLGGAIGVLVNTFYLVEQMGLPGSIRFAGIVNLAIAAVAWIAAPKSRQERQATSTREDSAARMAPLLLFAAAITGAASFMYEIGWIRMLSMVLGSSTHSFELMLAAFILGLALGGWWIRNRMDTVSSPLLFLAVVQALMGATALATLWAYGYSFDAVKLALSALARSETGYVAYTIFSHSLAFVLMLPATFCAGMTLPLMTYLLLHGRYGERAIGQVYAANTIGSIAGILLAVHVVMPAMGLKWVIVIGALLDIGLGFLLLARCGTSRGRWAGISAAMVGALVLVVTANWLTLDARRMGSGVYRTGNARLDDVKTRILAHRDGKTASIGLYADSSGTVMISTNGKPDATIDMTGRSPTWDETTMVLAGALALGHHPEARVVANIGMGSGLTTHTLLSSPQLERVDTIEIEREVALLARTGFGQRVFRAFSDPRGHLVIDDAKTYFALGRRTYDVIVSEPSNPWVSGVASLFSEEFYAKMRQHLHPGGVLVQWVQIYEIDLPLVASIVKALSHHFPDYALYNTDNSNLLIVAKRDGELQPISDHLFSQIELARELQIVGIHGGDDLRSRLIGTRASLQSLFERVEVPANSDFYPYLDLHAARARYVGAWAIGLTALGTADLPYLDLLEPGFKHADPQHVRPNPQFMRSRLINEAKIVANAIKHGGTVAMPPALGMPVMALQQDGDCGATHSTRLAALYELGKRAAPLLTVSDNDALWRKVAGFPCIAGDPELSGLLHLITAVGHRDAEVMVKAARAILVSNPPDDKSPIGQYPLKALVLGELAAGRPHLAIDAWNRYGVPALGPEPSNIELSWLVQSANSRVAELMADQDAAAR